MSQMEAALQVQINTLQSKLDYYQRLAEKWERKFAKLVEENAFLRQRLKEHESDAEGYLHTIAALRASLLVHQLSREQAPINSHADLDPDASRDALQHALRRAKTKKQARAIVRHFADSVQKAYGHSGAVRK